MLHLYDFVIYCFITAYTPGANNLLSMSNAIRLGFRRSVRFNLGILAGFTAVMTICTVFSTALYSSLPKIRFVMQFLGAAYMLFLAWKLWKSSNDMTSDGGSEASFLSGMILQFANPKIYIYANSHVTLYSSRLSVDRRFSSIYDYVIIDRCVRIFCMGIVWVGFLQFFLKTFPCGQSGDGSSADLLCSLTIYVNSQKNKDSFSCFWANGQKIKKDL